MDQKCYIEKGQKQKQGAFPNCVGHKTYFFLFFFFNSGLFKICSQDCLTSRLKVQQLYPHDIYFANKTSNILIQYSQLVKVSPLPLLCIGETTLNSDICNAYICLCTYTLIALK